MDTPIDPRRWSTGQVRELYAWTDKLFSIRVEADTDPFTAGQFTKLGLVLDGEFVSRPYSYVNAPGEEPLEFYFVTVPGGPLTGAMTQLQPGDDIYVMRKAAGFLTLDEVPAAEQLWLLATGTGIGPFLSILKTEQAWQTYRHIILVHAVRLAQELSFADTIDRLAQKHPDQFRFIPFVSREDTDFAIRGRIPAAIGDGRLEQRAGVQITPQASQVMICGNPDMVDATRKVLEARGLARNRRRSPGQITVENYW